MAMAAADPANDLSIEAYNCLLREDFSAFTHRVFKTVDPGAVFLPNWHIDLICDYLMALWRGELDKPGLIINIPPRYLKSITVSVAFPAFVMGHDPREQFVCASYVDTLSYEHSMHTRLVMKSPWYQRLFPGTRIARDQGEKREFKTTEQGHRQAASVGSSVTGFGGNWLIVDDPHDPNRAASDVLRQQALTWYSQTWSSRINDKKRGKFIVVMQRLHDRDLTGYLLEEQSEDYHVVKVPAKATEHTVIDFGRVKKVREKGDILHPEREDQEEISRVKRRLGEWGFSGQYQQDPVPAGGGILKDFWWREWQLKEPPVCFAIMQSYDTAYTEKHLDAEMRGEPSYSARTTWGLFEHRFSDYDENKRVCLILLEAWRDFVSYPDLRRLAKKAYDDYIGNSDLDGWVLIEAKASGQALIADMRRNNLPVRTYRPGRYEDKIVRAHMAAPLMEAGLVYYMPREWAKDVIKDVSHFPAGASSDWTDTLTQAVLFIKHNMWIDHPDDDVDPDEADEEKQDLNRLRPRSYG